MFPVEPPPTSCAARWASSRAVGLLLAAVVAAVAASMKLSEEISSASDLLKRELIPLPNARPGDEAEGILAKWDRHDERMILNDHMMVHDG